MVITLSQAFQTQSAVFTVTFPPIPETREALDFDAEGMEDKSSGRDALPRVRRVGILVFPGVTKTTKTTKTTIAAHTFLVKTKVVCTDEMERYIGKIST